MKIILKILLFLSLLPTCNFQYAECARKNNTSKRAIMFDKHKYYYSDRALCEFAARFINEKEIILKGVKFIVGGDDSISSLRIKIYGNEGGANVPRYGQELLAPITFVKKHPGIKEYEVKFPTPIRIKENGYFISFDSLVGNIAIISARNTNNCFCSSTNSGSYYRQAIKDTLGKWYVGSYLFAVMPIYDLVDDKKGNYFSQIKLDESLKFAVNNVVVADINSDGKPDLILDGKYYENKGDFNFSLNKEYCSTDSVIFQSVLDIDNNGYLDLLVFAERDSITHELHTILYRNTGNKFIRMPLKLEGIYNPQTIACEDVNNDNYDDIVISQIGDSAYSVNVASIIFLNDKNNSFIEATNYRFGEKKSLPPSKFCSIIDFTMDAVKEIVLIEESGLISHYSLQGNVINENIEPKIQRSFDSVYNKNITSHYPTDIAQNSIYKRGDNEIAVSSALSTVLKKPSLNTRILNCDNDKSDFRVSAYGLTFQEIESGLCAIDVNNDCLNDLIVLTGDTCRPPSLYLGSNDKGYSVESLLSGFNAKNVGKDVITSDLNIDGKMDAISIINRKLVIFKNTYSEVEEENNYVKIQNSPGKKIKTLTASIGDTLYDYSTISSNGYNMQSVLTSVNISLGKNKNIDKISLYTTDGRYYESENLKANHSYTIEDLTQKDLSNEPSIIAWPTPFDNQIEFKITNPSPTNYSLSIKDNSGNIVFNLQNYKNIIDNTYIWNGVNESGVEVPNGVYFLEYKSESIVKYLKFLKLR